MGNQLSRRMQFVAEIAEYFPELYHHQERFNYDGRRDAYDEIENLANEAHIQGIDRYTIVENMQYLKDKYNYVQLRVGNGHLLANMISRNLKIFIACHYLFDHTTHRRFRNRNLIDVARHILEQREDLYIPLPEVQAMRNLLRNRQQQQEQQARVAAVQPVDEVQAVMNFLPNLQQQAGVAAVQPVDEEVILPYQLPLPRRRAGDYADVIEVIEENLDE